MSKATSDIARNGGNFKSDKLKCPSIQDLQESNPRLLQELRKMDKTWRIPRVQRLLKQLNSPLHIYLNDKDGKEVWNNYLKASLESDRRFNTNTLMFPLISDCFGNYLCYDCYSRIFWICEANDYKFKNQPDNTTLESWVDNSLNTCKEDDQENIIDKLRDEL